MLKDAKGCCLATEQSFLSWRRTRENLSKQTRCFYLCLCPPAYGHFTAEPLSHAGNLFLMCYCLFFQNHWKCDRSSESSKFQTHWLLVWTCWWRGVSARSLLHQLIPQWYWCNCTFPSFFIIKIMLVLAGQHLASWRHNMFVSGWVGTEIEP